MVKYRKNSFISHFIKKIIISLNFKKLNYKLLTLLLIFVFSLLATKISLASSLPYQMRGYFLIQVDNNGKAWYIDSENGLKHKLDKNNSAWHVINDFALGISKSDLSKIPIGINSNLTEKDSDGDRLDDKLEKAIGTNEYNSDSDKDSYNDYLEITNNYNPLGLGTLFIDKKMATKLKGKILLDVERNGEVWYVNPKDSFRYYIYDYNNLFKLISVIGQGINSENLDKITDSAIIKDKNKKSIEVDVGKSQLLHYFLDGVEIGTFPVSAGKYSTPTPKGGFKIINKHPLAWSSYGLWMPYWMGLGTGRFGFHELPIWPSGYREGASHLGMPVSHGCIRLGIGPAEFLYNFAEIGTEVKIY